MITIKELHAERDGKDIWGEICLPEKAEGKLPVVITSHEFNMTHESMAGYAGRFAEAGIAAYVFDYCGGSKESRSGGSMMDLSWLTEIEDLKAVIGMIKDQPFTDPGRIFLMGGSMGGSVAALTAADLGDEIRGLVLLYPALKGPETARKNFASKESMPEIISATTATMRIRLMMVSLGRSNARSSSLNSSSFCSAATVV